MSAAGAEDQPVRLNPMISGPNRMKLGLFGIVHIPVQTLAPELYTPTWRNALKVVQKADAIGFEAILPVARWKGFLDDRFEHPSNEILDAYTFAAGMAQATRQCTLVVTTHAPTIHPVLLAKQTATIDQIAEGRFALNIVGGWNRREFDVFGIEMLDHAERYAYLQEWLDVIRRLWTEEAEFDYHGTYFQLKGALSRPHPIQKPNPPIINAGLSEVGNRFAARNADVGFIVLSGTDKIAWRKQTDDFRALARENCKDIKIWATLVVTVRDTDEEARQYEHRVTEELLDTDAVDGMLETMLRETPADINSPRYRTMRQTLINGGGYGVTGSPETVARVLADMSEAGVDGVVMRSVDYMDLLVRFERQVLPLLEEMGLREPVAASQCV